MARRTIPQNMPLEPLPVETQVTERLAALPEQVLRDYAAILRRRNLQVQPLPDGRFRLAEGA